MGLQNFWNHKNGAVSVQETSPKAFQGYKLREFGLSGQGQRDVQAEGRFRRSATICDQTTQHIYKEVRDTTMARVLNLRNVFGTKYGYRYSTAGDDSFIHLHVYRKTARCGSYRGLIVYLPVCCLPDHSGRKCIVRQSLIGNGF